MDAIITTDEAQNIVLFNRAAEQLFRVRREEMLGTRLDRLIPARFRGAHRGHIDQFGRTGVTSRRMGDVTTLWALRPGTEEEIPIEASISQALEDGRHYFTVILRDISVRKQAEEGLLASQRELRELSARVLEAREDEKARIARELHDELGQLLTALKMDLSWLRERVRDTETAPKLEEMGRLLDQTVSSTRRISADLRPLMLDDLGLADAASWLVEDFGKRYGIASRIEISANGGLEHLSKKRLHHGLPRDPGIAHQYCAPLRGEERVGAPRNGGRQPRGRGRGRRPRHRARGPRQDPLARVEGHARAHRVHRRLVRSRARSARRHAAQDPGPDVGVFLRRRRTLSEPILSRRRLRPRRIAARLGAMQVFLVEDSAAIRERVAAMLEATPNAELVGHAADAVGAIRDILAGAPDLVLLDISLAGGSGFDVLRAVRPQAPQIDFYVLSNVSAYPYRQLADNLGARGFFDKSTEFERVRELIAARAGAEGGAP
jgi:PAS domain S-box-containing protein